MWMQEEEVEVYWKDKKGGSDGPGIYETLYAHHAGKRAYFAGSFLLVFLLSFAFQEGKACQQSF
jgi:hypothetical protein